MADIRPMGPPPPGDDPWQLGIDVTGLIRVLRESVRTIVAIGFAVAVAAAGLSLLRANVYDAEVTLVPNEARGPGGIDLGKASDLAQAVGISIPGGDGASTYATVIYSRRVMDAVLTRDFPNAKLNTTAPLDSLFRAKAPTPERGRAAALKWLRNQTSVSSDNRTGVWRVVVRHENPEVAAGIANALVDEADAYRRDQSTGEAAATRAFIESRMDSTRTRLRQSEEALKTFRAQNVRINKSPDLMLAEGRLIRDARIQEEIFLTLTKQHELAKINEAYHQPELVVLDRASPPVFKSGPMRTRLVLMAGVLGVMLGVVVVLIRAYRPDRVLRAAA